METNKKYNIFKESRNKVNTLDEGRKITIVIPRYLMI